ncbi:unnamed protein product [Rotaria sordida]|uniref:Peptidase S1 domain-containing protein n=1 Tax=Rotaria sordida TaxID=392033 RepID=A0A819DH94_9BILA|nr:unnamed protein product [Rotaria sordida]
MNARIINGENVVPYSWPMIVSLRYDCYDDGNISSHCCGGTILTDSYILTAAHCVNIIPLSSILAGNFTIAAGFYRRSQECQTIRKVDQIFIHPNWTIYENKLRYDIAILHLDEPLDFDTNLFISRTCLPPRLNSTNDIINYPPSNISLAVIGWGFLHPSNFTPPDILQQTTLLSIHQNHSMCARSINHIETQFCAGDVEGSKGDSGGPILQWIGDRWEQVGIVSYMIFGCSSSNNVTVFTRIAALNNWIESILTVDNTSTSTTIDSTIISTTTDTIPSIIYHCEKQNVSCGCSFLDVSFPLSRIIGGHEAKPFSWSMVVSLLSLSSNEHFCGGSVLNNDYILTSARCVENQSILNILVVTIVHNPSDIAWSQYRRRVEHIYFHPNYTSSSGEYLNDIAILRLSFSLGLETTLFISRTCLPKINSTDDVTDYPSTGTKLAVVGWGKRHPNASNLVNNLQQAQVYTLDNNDPTCYPQIVDPKNQFCAGIADGIRGDMGGPIFQWMSNHWEQVGIISTTQCGINSVPSIYTRLASYNSWITSVMDIDDTTSTTTSTSISITSADPIIHTYLCNKNMRDCGCGYQNVQLATSRIVGGNEAIPYSWSMIISIRYNCNFDGNVNAHCCGGTILNDYYILTAARCVEQIDQSSILSQNITIVAGIHNLSEVNQIIRHVDQIFIHPKYAGQSYLYKNDIAILHLDKPLGLDINPFITRTCLPPRINSSEDIVEYPSNGSMLVTIGWGITYQLENMQPQALQQVGIYAIHHNNPMCERSIGHINVQFCGGLYDDRTGICFGDFGGPIFKWLDDHWQQVGISSYVINDCASVDYQSVFTRLAAFYDWIEEVVNQRNITTLASSKTTTTSTAINTTKSSDFFPCNRSVSCGCGYNDVLLTSLRIVGSEDAIDHSWSMLVSLRFGTSKVHGCDGTILSASYILTAAHCVWRYVEWPSMVSVAAGMTNRSDQIVYERNVSRIYLHPNYTHFFNDFRNDIALLYIDRPFIFHHNEMLAKTCVHHIDPSLSISQYPKNGTRLVMIGWSTMTPESSESVDHLQQVQVYAIDNHDPACSDSINDVNMQFCAGLYEEEKGQ